MFGEAGETFVSDVGVAAAQAVRTREGEPCVVLTGSIQALEEPRGWSAQETLVGEGLVAVPLPAEGAREGDIRPLPPRNLCVLRPGGPAELMLLRPLERSGDYRVERVIRYER